MKVNGMNHKTVLLGWQKEIIGEAEINIKGGKKITNMHGEYVLRLTSTL